MKSAVSVILQAYKTFFLKRTAAFFQESLRQSIIIKGHQYENIRHRQSDFDLVTHSIEAKQTISFNYTKADGSKSHRTLDPYRLINKSGIWYLIGLENGREKTYCFTQTSQLQTTSKTYVPDVGFVEKIQNTDSISYGNQVSEIIIQISPQAAHYFLRRKLLPNQEVIRRLDNGGLLIACKNVNEIEVIPHRPILDTAFKNCQSARVAGKDNRQIKKLYQ